MDLWEKERMLGEASLHLRASHERMLPSSGFVGTEEPGSFRRKSGSRHFQGWATICGLVRAGTAAAVVMLHLQVGLRGQNTSLSLSELPSRTPSADLSLWLCGMKEDVVS